MFAICRQTHPATGIEHAISCCFFNNDEVCLITAGANIVKVFRLVPEGHTKEVNAAGQPVPPKMKLECLATYTLWGNVMSIASVKCPSAGRDLLLVSFKEAKLSVLQYDPQTNNLATLSMHYFEEEDMKGGWTTHPHIPWIRVDPEFRCAVMLLYGRKLAVLPFRKDITSEEGDPLEAKPLSDNKKNQGPQTVTRAPTLASYVIVLKELDEKIDNILDIQFLYGYYEPTLLLLYEPVRTFAGRTAVRTDTCAMAGVSLNMSARVHPVIWATGGLPFDCIQAVPLQKPLGGCLIMAVNSLIYLNQSVPPYGVSLNSVATHTTNFPLRIQEGVCITLDAARVAALGDTRLALALRGGQLYVLTLLSDSVRSVRSFHLDRAAASVLTSCMCVLEEDFLFLGSRLGNSLLLRVTERENRMLFSVDKPLEATVDLTVPESEREKESTNKETQKESAESAAKKRRLENLSDCVASNVIEICDKDELEVYGSDIRTSTQLTSYVFEVCDSLLNICPIGDVTMGELQLLTDGEENKRAEGLALELVCCSGRGKNGALTVLQRSVRPQLVTAFKLPGCIDMWTVIGEASEVNREAHRDMEGTHAYLILTQEDSSMILQTGQEINEVDNSGFMTSAPTIFAGNLGNNKFMVQVTTLAIRLVRNGVLVQSISLEWTAKTASTADPYLCVVSTCGRALVLALRELRARDATSARLAPTRQAVPHRPPLLKAVPYRDLSGLFTTTDMENVQVKGEFTGKMKGKNIKAEGFKPGAVYELNDEDELLYGGDQTPASMASIMLAEQSKNPGVPRRVSRWWRRHLMEPKPSFWLFVVRDNGNLEIYSLPEMRLSFLVRDVCAGERILADSLESVPILTNPTDEEELNTGHSTNVEKLQEILVVGLGNKGSRVLMLLRCDGDQLMIYQAYKYPRGNLKMRFSRMLVSFPFGYRSGIVTCADDGYEASALRESVRQMRYFGNVGGYNGVFICGHTPYILLLGSRGELRLHPLCPDEGPVSSFASFNNTNCPQGFLYFNAQVSLRISVLPTHLSYEAAWAVRKVPLRETPHAVTFHVESKTYCLVCSTATPTQSYYKFNGEDKEKSTENKGDRFPYPLQDRFSVMLFSPVSWEIIPNTRIEFEEWEHVTCFKNVSLSYEGTRSGLRGYIAIGTNYNYGEDITSRGRIIIYDIIDVVPEPGQPLTKNRFKEIYAKEQKGPVTALTQVLGFLISAVGQKIYIWQLKDNDLVGVAFIDTQIYVHRMLAVKNLILVADVYKSISLLRYQDQQRTLSLVSRDLRTAQIYEMEFMVDNMNLGFLVSDLDGNFALFMYQPQARESYGGQRLIRKCDYHLGQQVHAMFRIAARATPGQPPQRRHVTMFTTLDGGLGYVLPVSEKVYRRLLMLQNVMNNYCCHIAGLNPRAHRTYKSARKAAGGGAARGILDGDLVALYTSMPIAEQQDIAKKIGTKVEEIMGDLYEIDRLTAHF
ncbi:cleavage and polyadenylation specificity factor subunit 1 isoform X1 [Maniola jurtina]|uniref:cleavage and polyadenylation specificity factor subunit 1 isoform X1 n=2 Tax=Maniola jurtina TaxID=191418 RepID=UPI001E68DC32|nr:cleavage and polyadenylation specificity factor subunit 1 isoform X1 [Maniola jurtina]